MSSVVIAGDTSGTVTISAPAVAGTPTLTLPTTSGTILTTASTTGISGSAISTGTVGVSVGGTGRTTNVAYSVVCGGTTTGGAEQSVASVGTSGQVLTSGGAGALPTWTTISSTPTTAQVLSATAGAVAGDVGSYAWLMNINGSVRNQPANTNIAGSDLAYSNIYFSASSAGSAALSAGMASGTLSGTYKMMCQSINNSNNNQGLFLRVS